MNGDGRLGDDSEQLGGEDDGRPAWQLFVYDVASAFLGVLLVGGLLLAVSGVWPPLVAIESPSMEPHINTGDLVFVMEEERFPGPAAHDDTGVVTAHRAEDVGYVKFKQPGDVIVFEPGGNAETTPIIHRAMFWVEKDERWFDEANPDYVGRYDSCQEMPHCPADNAGFITKGDNNGNYDQVNGGARSKPVRPDWIIGTAEMRIPGLGRLRLGLEGMASGSPQANVAGVPLEVNGSSRVAAGG